MEKDGTKTKEPVASKKSSKKPKVDRPVVQSEDESDEGPRDPAARQDVQKLVAFGKDEEINHENVAKKLNEVIAMRGRRGTNRRDQLECLKILRAHVEKQNLGVGIYIKILLVQIAVSFDYHHKSNECLKPEAWTGFVVPSVERASTSCLLLLEPWNTSKNCWAY